MATILPFQSNVAPSLDAQLALPDASPVLDASVGIPQSAAAPAMVEAFGENTWDVQARETAASQAEWQTKAQDTFDKIVADPDAHFKARDLSFARSVKEGQRLAINDAFMALHNGGEPVPVRGLDRHLLRVTVANQLFDGKGAESEDAFHAEILRDHTQRKDDKALGEYLHDNGWNTAVIAGIQPGASPQDWKSTRESIKAMPGYRPEAEADYHEQFHAAEMAGREILQPFAPQLQQVWSKMTQGGAGTASEVLGTASQALAKNLFTGLYGTVTGVKAVFTEAGSRDAAATAFDVYGQLPEGQRENFMNALGLVAKAFPKEEKAGFFANLAKQGGRDVDNLASSAFEAGVMNMFSGMPIPGGIGQVMTATSGQDAKAKTIADKARSDFMARKNFASDVRRIEQNAYNPMKSAWRTGAPGLVESGLYGIPGALASTAEAAIPFAGVPLIYLSMQGQAYDDLRNGLRQSGMSEADASTRAEQWAPYLAIPQAALEKLEASLWLGKLPILGKTLGAMGDKIKTRLLRGAARSLVGGVEETAIEQVQNLMVPLTQDIGNALDADVPDVRWTGKDGVLDGFWGQSFSIFVSMLPLAILGAAGGVSQEARAGAFAKATPEELAALGMRKDHAAAIHAAAAKGQSSLNRAVDVGMLAADPHSAEARAAVDTLVKAQVGGLLLAQEGKAAGVLPDLVHTAAGWSVRDRDSGEEIGASPDAAGALKIVQTHTTAMDDFSADHIAYVGTMMEAAQQARALGKGEEDASVSLELANMMTEAKAATEDPRNAKRYAEQIELKERMAGGDGSIAQSILGASVSASDQRAPVERLFAGSSVTDVFHETFHRLRRDARAAGRLTREDEIAVLRSLDTVLNGKWSKGDARSTQQLRFLPKNLADAEITDTMLDEACGHIGEMEILRSRKGKGGPLTLKPGFITRNLNAIAKLAPEAARKFTAFLNAVRAHWGLSLQRALALRKAEREGIFDKARYEGYLNKLLGTDAQAEHDAAVEKAAADIYTSGSSEDMDIPFSIGVPAIILPLDSSTTKANTVGDERVRNPKTILEAITGQEPRVGAEGVRADGEKRRKLGRELVGYAGIMEWAKRSGRVLEPGPIQALGGSDAPRGGEHVVLYDETSGRVVKLSKPGLFGAQGEDGGKYLQRWALHNQAFGDDVRFEGMVTLPGETEARAVISQRFAKGKDTAFSIGPADLAGFMMGDAIRRIKDPLRRVQAMSKVARNFESLKLVNERLELLAGGKRPGKSLLKEAAMREAMRAEELAGEVWGRHYGILSDEDLTRIKAQPGHQLLADPDSHLRGRIMSKTQALKDHPDMFRLHRAGEYDGADGISRAVFGGTLMPDQAAQELFDAHLIKEPTADAMWNLLRQEQAMVGKMKEAQAKAKEEANAWLANETGNQKENYSPKVEILRALVAMDAIMTALPPEIRGKLGGYTQMARLGSDDARLDYLREKLAAADKELESWMRKSYDAEFRDLLKRSKPTKDAPGEKPTGKLTPEIHDIFRLIEAAMFMDAKQTEAEAGRLDGLAEHADTSPEDAAHYTMAANMVRLVGNWSKADAGRRESAFLEADKMFAGGYMAAKILWSKRAERREKARGALIGDVNRLGTTGDKEERKKKVLEENSLKGGWKKNLVSLLSFEHVLHFVFGENSVEANSLNDAERNASYRKSDSINASMVALEDLFTSLAGSRLKGEILRYDMGVKNDIQIILWNGKTETFTQLQAIAASMMWRQDDGKRHMEGVLDDTGKPVGEWHYRQADMDAIESQITPEAKAVRLHLIERYAAEYERINTVFRGLYGVNMPHHKNYSPITVKPQQAAAGQMVDPVSGFSMNGTSVTPGSLRNRSQSAVAEPDFRDALQTYIGHTKQMEHFIAYAGFASEAMALLNRRDVGNSVQASAGEEGLGVLRAWVDYFAQGGTRDAAAHLAFNKQLNRNTNRAASMALVGRASVLAIQSVQLGAALAEMPTVSFAKRLGMLFTGQLGWGEAIRSEYIQRRLQELPPVVRQAMEGMHSARPNVLTHQIARLGNLIGGADALFTAGSFAIVHDYQRKVAREHGLTAETAEAFALQSAERITDRIAQPTRPGARSLFEATSTNPIMKLVWAFSSEGRQKLAYAAWQLANPDASAARKARALAVAWLVGGLGASLVRAVVRDLKDEGKDDKWFDEKNWGSRRLALSALTGPLQGIPVFGDLVQGAVFKAFGEYQPSGNLFSNVSQGAAAAKHVPGWFDGEGDVSTALKDAEAILSGMGVFNDTIAAAASLSHLARDLYGVTKNVVH